MKQRFECVTQSRDLIEKALRGREYDLRFRQLYHDREEVTGFYRDLRQR